MKYVLLAFTFALLTISCTSQSGSGTGFAPSSSRPTTGSEGVPGYIIRNPSGVKSKLIGSQLTVTAPAGTVESSSGKVEEANLALWNTSATELQSAAQSSDGSKQLSEGHELAQFRPNADGSFSVSVSSPTLDKDSIAFFLVENSQASVLKAVNNQGELLAAYQQTPQPSQEVAFVPITQIIQIAFVTSSKFSPDFGGVAFADSICDSLGKSGSVTKQYPGVWKAVISGSATSAASRIQFSPNSTLINSHLETIVANSSNLWGGSIQNAIRYDQNGADLIGATDKMVFTGSQVNGTAAADHCTNWTSGANGTHGIVGLLDQSDFRWISDLPGNAAECDVSQDKGRFYCINSAE